MAWVGKNKKRDFSNARGAIGKVSFEILNIERKIRSKQINKLPERRKGCFVWFDFAPANALKSAAHLQAAAFEMSFPELNWRKHPFRSKDDWQ